MEPLSLFIFVQFLDLLIYSIVLFCIVFLISVFEITKIFLVRHDEKETIVYLTEIRGAVPEKPTVSFVEPHTERKTEYPTEKKTDIPVFAPKNEEQNTVQHIENHRSMQNIFEMNSDCFGWISVADTNISYPVMHTPYDSQKYLHMDFYENYSYSGVPFLDYRCSEQSNNLIVYGHHMNDGRIFSDLCNYTDRNYFNNHLEILWENRKETAYFQVFAVAVVSCYDDWYLFTDASTDEHDNAEIEYLMKKSLYHTENIPQNRQQLLTLSTCTNADEDGRIIVAAVKK